MTELETSTHLALVGFHVEPHEVNCPNYHTINWGIGYKEIPSPDQGLPLQLHERPRDIMYTLWMYMA